MAFHKNSSSKAPVRKIFLDYRILRIYLFPSNCIEKDIMVKIIERLKSVLSDPRYFQILFLSGFLAYGVFNLNWSIETTNFIILISTCLLVQTIGIFMLNLPWHSLRSALITSLGLCLLFKAGDPSYYILAGILAIGSKFILRFKGKHIFNPANFGLVVPILLTNQTWISPGQWGSSLTMLIFFGAAGLMILLKISRLETGITFLLVFFLLLLAKDFLYAGWNFEVVIHKMTNGALLLFAFFMITDPMTIPNNKRIRIIWAAVLSIVAFGIGNIYYLHTAAIWLLFIGAPIVPLLDYLFPASKFKWNTVSNTQQKKFQLNTSEI